MFKLRYIIRLIAAVIFSFFAAIDAYAWSTNEVDIFGNLEYIPDSQLGSNIGGKYRDKNSNQEYYVKFYADEMQARTEFLANKIYALFGLNIPESFLETAND